MLCGSEEHFRGRFVLLGESNGSSLRVLEHTFWSCLTGIVFQVRLQLVCQSLSDDSVAFFAPMATNGGMSPHTHPFGFPFLKLFLDAGKEDQAMLLGQLAKGSLLWLSLTRHKDKHRDFFQPPFGKRQYFIGNADCLSENGRVCSRKIYIGFGWWIKPVVQPDP